MKRLIRYLLNFIGFLFLLIGISNFFAESLAKHTIENSKNIEELFITSSKYIDSQKKLPSSKEFYDWANPNLHKNRYFDGLHYYTTQTYKQNDLKIPKNGYLLQLWRGEWNEYYYSWKKKKSTISLSMSDYFFTGYSWLDAILAIAISILLFYLSRVIKRRNKPTNL